MKFLKIAGKDIGDIFKNRFIRVSVIAIIIVPLLYSLLYLDAFWDPYAKLQDMPVAVVNLDNGGTNDGETVNYGEDVVNNLKDSTAVGWKFTNEKDADKGVKGNKYYAKLVIPEDFSKKVLAAKDGEPEVANVIFSGNEKKNFLASQINSRLQVELEAQLVKSISSNYVTVAFNSLNNSKDGFTAAADGSKQVYDGLSSLNDKVPALESGINTLTDGTSQILNGQVSLDDAIGKVNTGLLSLNGKVPELATGVSSLYSGSNSLKAGLSNASTGASALAKGSNDLYSAFSSKIYPSVSSLTDGASELDSKLQEGKGSIEELNAGAAALKVGSTQIAQGSVGLKDGYGQVKSGVDGLITGVEDTTTTIGEIGQALVTAVKTNPEVAKDPNVQVALQKLAKLNEDNKDLPEQLKELGDGTTALENSIGTFNDGIQGYTSNVSKFADGATALTGSVSAVANGVNQLSVGLNTLQVGLNENNKGSFGEGVKNVATNMTSLNNGVNALSNGATEINSGLNKLNEQTPVLTNGVEALYTGSNAMRTGSQQLVSAQNKLNDGVKELGANVPTLKEGVDKLYNGSKELSSKLSSGAEDLKNGLKNSPEVMAEFISSPVDLKNEPINAVPNYGTGFAPYFISLSLWIGAIMMFFVISSKTDEDEDATKFDKVIGKYISFAFVGILQAILVSAVVLMLGLKPASVPMYFAINIFLSLVFVAIIQCLIFLFGDAGRLLAIILLILQLTACAGTFPLEIVPSFFKVLNPFMPFTYAVEALREVISATTIDYSVVFGDVAILSVVWVVFLSISVALKNVGERISSAIEGRKIA